jgi:DNA uptake protein ComE-like DNA-binding protein
MKFFRELLYLQKSDRKVILTLLVVIAIALGVIFLTGGQNDSSNALVFADSIDNSAPSKHYRDSFHKKPYHERTVYVRTKVIYRDTAYQRGRHLPDAEHDSVVALYQPKIRRGEHVVLNTADTTQLKTVPGIGPYFARKIVEYGERLGGYVSVDQLDEIEDFPLEAKRYLVIENPSPRKLNINRLSLNDLRKHPYLNFYQARIITDYRRLHGPLKSLQDLRLSKDFSPEVIARLEPYIEY